jgi:hypothetical protein
MRFLNSVFSSIISPSPTDLHPKIFLQTAANASRYSLLHSVQTQLNQHVSLFYGHRHGLGHITYMDSDTDAETDTDKESDTAWTRTGQGLGHGHVS